MPRPRSIALLRVNHAPAVLAALFSLAVFSSVTATTASAQSGSIVVPGTGSLVNTDDFEDEKWGWRENGPKSSKENDEQVRYPLGKSFNGRWFESPKRGRPDRVERIETPPGGLEGSMGALLLQSRHTGIPGRPEFKQNQDDFIMSPKAMSLSARPNCVVRVYIPEWDQWEQRTGVSFGMRAGLVGPQDVEEEVQVGLFRKRTVKKMVHKDDGYYPGFFIQYNPKSDPRYSNDHAVFVVRAQTSGHDKVIGPKITRPGWWTLGMSFESGGYVHFFASPGVDDLTMADHLMSSQPYGIPGHRFNTIFFNICSADNGKSWSTPWIVDDPKIYMASGRPRTASRGRGRRR